MTVPLAALIDLDVTFFIQLCLFLVLVFVLNRLAFRPMLALFERRREQTEVREEAAKGKEKEAAELLGGYHAEIAAAVAAGAQVRNAARDEALAEQGARLTAARAESAALYDRELGAFCAEMEAQRAAAMPSIEATAGEIMAGLTRGGGRP
jgi:F-type H+-transporting ATPase subunit b